MRILGFIVIVVLMLAGIHMGGALSAFFDATAMLIVAGTTIGGFCMAAGSETGSALKAAFSGSEAHFRAGLHGFRGGRIGALVGGFLSVMIGLVLVLAKHNDPGAYGPGLALTLLGFLWGVFVAYAILLPLQTGIERRMMAAEGKAATSSETGLDLLVLGVGLCICTAFYVILKAAFAA